MPTRSGETSSAATAVITPDLSAAWLGGLAEGLRGRRSGALALLVAHRAEGAAGAAAALAAAGVPAHTFDLGAALPLASPPRRRVKSRVSPRGRVIPTAPAGSPAGAAGPSERQTPSMPPEEGDSS